MVVIANRASAIRERLGGEITIIARETILDGAPERRLVARARYLLVVRQAGGVAIDRTAHAERMRLFGHHARESIFIAADCFTDRAGDVIGRLRDQRLDRVLHLDAAAGRDPEF